MNKYKVNDKYKVTPDKDSNGQDGPEKPEKRKYRRKSSTKGTSLKGDLHPRSRSLSLGALNSAELQVVEIPQSPDSKKTMDFVHFSTFTMKGYPYAYENMYGYKDQYDSVGKHTDKGIDFLERYSNFLKKRCEIETSYASELKRLVRNFQPKKKEEDEYQFSWAKAFLDTLKELHDLAGQHEVIAENTQQQLIQDIHKCCSELKNDRRKYLAEGAKIQSQMKDSLKALDSAKKNYDKKYSESERALDSYRRADADINLSRAEVEKSRSISNKRSQEAEDSKTEYAKQLRDTNDFQKSFHTSQMPAVFQNLQEMDERRINKIKHVIRQSASLEQNVLPIINTCIEGMLKSSDSVNPSADSSLVINKYRTGFPIPGDIPFEDNSNGPVNNVISPDNRNLKSGGTLGGGKSKQRKGLFNIFKGSNTEEQKEDLSNEPPAQRKAKLQKKIDELKNKIAHETAEREGMLKMKEVYENNPALGDPNSLNKKIEQNTAKLSELQADMKKFQEYLANAENDMATKRRGSNDSLTTSITSEGSANAQVSAPGTPIQQHNQEEYYECKRNKVARRQTILVIKNLAGSLRGFKHHATFTPPRPVEEPPMDPEPEPGTPEDEFAYPVIGTCRALYPFEAVNDGSVNMSENEEMWVLEQDQGDGWTRVRKNDGGEGFVPTSYVQCHFYDQDAV